MSAPNQAFHTTLLPRSLSLLQMLSRFAALAASQFVVYSLAMAIADWSSLDADALMRIGILTVLGLVIPIFSVRWWYGRFDQIRSINLAKFLPILFVSAIFSSVFTAVIWGHIREPGPRLDVSDYMNAIGIIFLLSTCGALAPSAAVKVFSLPPFNLAKWLFLLERSDAAHPDPDFLLTRAKALIEAEPALGLTRAAAIHELLDRAGRLRAINAALILVVCFVLVSVAVFVVLAGKVAGQDSQGSSSVLQQLRMDVDEAEHRLRRAEEELTRQYGQQAFPQLSSQATKDEAAAQLAALQAAQAVWRDRMVRAKMDYDRISALWNDAERQRYVDNFKPRTAESEKTLLVAAGITRFGVLAVAIYLVQILIGLYRYNANAAALYSSQADALLLLGTVQNDKLGELVAKLRPRFSFGKPETSLPEKFVEKLALAIKAAADVMPKHSQDEGRGAAAGRGR